MATFIFTQEDVDQMLEHHRFQIEQTQNSQSTQKASSNEVEELKLKLIQLFKTYYPMILSN